MKNICVFLSASDVPEKYLAPAKEFARLLAKRKFNLVWGGSDKGLMKVVADEVKKYGGYLISVTMPLVQQSLKKDSDEVVIGKDLPERKKIMAEKSDAFVVLVGGIGSLDEATELLELKKHLVHDKPIIFLNSYGFYNGLKTQFEKMESEGFLPRPLVELISFVKTPEEVMLKLTK